MSANPNSKIRIGGVEYPLYFGMQAAEEVGRRTEQYLTQNSFKIFVDIVYAGMSNHFTKLDVPPLSYKDVYELVEEFVNEDDSSEQQDAIARAFNESKYGSELLQKYEDIKKKLEKATAEVKKKATTGQK